MPPSPSNGATEQTGDPDIRRALKGRIRAQFENDPDTVLIEELGLCRHEVRVDLAVVNGRLHGYEIKSDRDTLRRLARQANVYGRVLDRVTLVTGPAHAAEALHLVPAWWGILTAVHRSGHLALKICRRGRLNPSRSARSLIELLWLDEALELLDARGGTRGYLGKPRCIVWDRVCELYDLNEIAEAARTRLKARPSARSARSCA